MSERHESAATGRTLRCDEARVLLMGYIDGELGDADRLRLEDHLAVCVACRGEERAYRQLGRVTAGALREQRIDADIGVAWMRIYEALEGTLARVLVWSGLTLVSGFGLWQLFATFLFDPEVPIALRLGTAALTAGCLLLLISSIRDRLRTRSSERYEEIQR